MRVVVPFTEVVEYEVIVEAPSIEAADAYVRERLEAGRFSSARLFVEVAERVVGEAYAADASVAAHPGWRVPVPKAPQALRVLLSHYGPDGTLYRPWQPVATLQEAVEAAQQYLTAPTFPLARPSKQFGQVWQGRRCIARIELDLWTVWSREPQPCQLDPATGERLGVAVVQSAVE